MLSRLLRFSPQVQPTIRRSLATISPSNLPPPSSTSKTVLLTNGAKLAKDSTRSSKTRSQPKVEEATANTTTSTDAEVNVFKVLFEGHKNQRLAIATVIVCAVSADACFSYFMFFHGRKEGEFIKTDTILDRWAQRMAPYLIDEDGLSPMEK
ncbi:hypothetical protein BGZ46_001110 [Entomortierella lignicola]|nr:hypothetical protein BGZ46_001110 [Entomortierella lignicola]